MPYLESHQIGRLSKFDEAIVAQQNAETVHAQAMARGKEIARERGLRLLGVMVLMPVLFFFKKLWRLVGLVAPSFVRTVSNQAKSDPAGLDRPRGRGGGLTQ